MKYTVIDLETSVKNVGEEAVGSMKAAPWHPKNKIVLTGWKSDMNLPGSTMFNHLHLRLLLDDGTHMLIGHNIKFDLHYLMVQHSSAGAWLHTGEIWDTQLAEYLLSGQTKIYPSLDYCSEKYGGTLKDDQIKKMWDAGVDTEDIPLELLKEYLSNDVNNTELVFLCQYVAATELGMMPLIKSQMKALKATIEMEFNGMHFDRRIANDLHAIIQPQLDDLYATIATYMSHECGIHDPNPNSNVHIGLMLFGGIQKYLSSEAQLDAVTGMPKMYKTGPRKGHPVLKNMPQETKIFGTYEGLGTKTPSGQWAVGNDALSKFKDPVVQCILEMRGLSKDIATYYEGYSELVWGSTNLIHHSLNHCSTGTGRLSCTSPNLQNTTTED
jgi:DNA polymerase I